MKFPSASVVSFKEILMSDLARRWGKKRCIDEFGVLLHSFLDVFWGSKYEPRDFVDCSHGCPEGPGIFLERFHFLRALIVVCGEGEVMGVMA